MAQEEIDTHVKISIVVPVYNVEKYLRACLDSLVGQTLRELEIICVDDGSTDGSPSILAEYAARDRRVTVITQANRGLSAARNTGLERARAEYVTFVDSDDAVEPCAYEQALAHMSAEVDYVCFGVSIVGDARAKRRYRKYFHPYFTGQVELSEAVMLRSNACVWNKIFRRSIIEQHGLRFPEGLCYEDNYFFQAYGAVARRGYYLADAWYRYSCRAGSITNSSQRETCRDGVQIARRLAELWRRQGLLEPRRHLLGVLLFRLASPALEQLRHAPEPQRHALLGELLRVAEELHLRSYPDLAYVCRLLTQDRYPQQRVNYCGGLLHVRQSMFQRTLSLLGLPLWRESYDNGEIHYLLMGLLRVRHRSVHHYAVAEQKLIFPKVTFDLDDSALLRELRALGPFSYQPDGGNMGDALLGTATMRWMDAHHLPWTRLMKGERPERLVYGGGGIWTPDYVRDTRYITRVMQSARRVVILPSSFRDVPEFVSMLDERFVIFCRERASYEYLCAQGTRARILLDHDMALRMPVCKRPSWWMRFKNRRTIRELFARFAALSDAPRLYRRDAEATASRWESELDISNAVRWFRPRDPRARYELGAWLLCALLSTRRRICTDRLHVGIAALLMGVRVSYRENSYGKIRSVCEQSLCHHPLVDGSELAPPLPAGDSPTPPAAL